MIFLLFFCFLNLFLWGFFHLRETLFFKLFCFSAAVFKQYLLMNHKNRPFENKWNMKLIKKKNQTVSVCACLLWQLRSRRFVHVYQPDFLPYRICTGPAAVPTAARRGSRTGWCWSEFCWRSPAGIKPWVTARASTCWPPWFWRWRRAARATPWRYEDAKSPEPNGVFDVCFGVCPLMFSFCRWWSTWLTKFCLKVTLPTTCERYQVKTSFFFQ